MPMCMRAGVASLAQAVIKTFFSSWVSPNLSVPQMLKQPEFFWIFQKKFKAKALECLLGRDAPPSAFPFDPL